MEKLHTNGNVQSTHTMHFKWNLQQVVCKFWECRGDHTLYQEHYEAIKWTVMPKTEMTDEKQETDKEWYSVHPKPLLF